MGSGLVLLLPKYTGYFIFVIRLIICILIVYMNKNNFDCQDMTNKSVEDQTAYMRHLFDVRNFSENLYIIFSMFLTPLQDRYFLTLISTSIYYAVEVLMLKVYDKNESAGQLIEIPVWITLILVQTYYIRYTLTSFFVLQKAAEKTRDALIQILDNLPDAVLMLEAD